MNCFSFNIVPALISLTCSLGASAAFAVTPTPDAGLVFKQESLCRSEGEFLHLRERMLLRHQHTAQPGHQGLAGQYFLMYWHPQQPHALHLYAQGPEGAGQWRLREGNNNAEQPRRLAYPTAGHIRALQPMEALFAPQDLPALQAGGYFLAGYGLASGAAATNDALTLEEMIGAERYHVLWQYQPVEYQKLGRTACIDFEKVRFSDYMLP
ncbi:MAG: hypothetical protein Q4A98_03820 [Comamonadaceae bacterium]|nr:hypothetical protein [Comamonadaceae bacterium]